ncbi:MAG: PD-(D/E)XK nuclease family protein [Byssovorax sp.]
MTWGRDAALLLVPSEQHLDIELAGNGPGVEVRTYSDFVESARCLRPGPERCPLPAARMVTGLVLEELGDERLPYPEEPPARAALAQAVDATLGRLRRAGTSPADLRALGLPQADLLAELLARTDAIFASRGLVDPRGVERLGAMNLRAASDEEIASLCPSGFCAVTGMLDLGPGDLGLVEAMHRRLRAQGGRGGKVILPRLPMTEDPVSELADDLERRWASLGDAPEIGWISTRRPAPLSIHAARNAEGQARAAVAAVAAALGRGTPPERIAIVVPTLDEADLEPLRAALGDAKVPFSEPRGRSAASSPEGRIALSLLAVAAGPVTREQVIELLRAPGLSAGVWTDPTRDAEASASLLVQRLRDVPVEIDRTGRLLLEGLDQTIRLERHRRPNDESWMPGVLEHLLGNARWVGEGVTSRSEIARRLLALLDRLRLGSPPARELAQALRAEARGPGGLSLRALGEGAAAVRALREAARLLVESATLVGLADRPGTVADFAAELGLLCHELGTGLGGRAALPGAVRIARPRDLAGLEHEVLVITGLLERAYGDVDGGDTLFDERIRRDLPPPCRPPSARERETARRAELAWTVAGADRLVLCYATGEEGDLATPHRLVRWAEGQAAPLRKEPASRIARHASPIDARSAELIALAAGAPPRAEIEERARIERARTAFFLDPRAPAGPYTGRVTLGDAESEARFRACVGGAAPDRTIAVTVIERAAGCAFAGFARRVLHIRRADDLGESADARERGTLIHRALEHAFRGMGEGDRGQQLALARAAAEKGLGLHTPMAPLRREALAQAIHDAMGVVARAIEAGDALRFRDAEVVFGAKEAPPWLPLELPGGVGEDGAPLPSVYVDGQIDRIDVGEGGRVARVIDYKTGRMPSAADHGQSAFQLPLYAEVVARSLGCAEVEAQYIAVKPRGVVDEWPKSEADRRALGGRRGKLGKAARRVIIETLGGEWRQAAEGLDLRPLRGARHLPPAGSDTVRGRRTLRAERGGSRPAPRSSDQRARLPLRRRMSERVISTPRPAIDAGIPVSLPMAQPPPLPLSEPPELGHPKSPQLPSPPEKSSQGE